MIRRKKELTQFAQRKPVPSGDRIERMKAARATLAADPLAPMTPEEIDAEIDAYRTGRRRAAGS